jgi:simple sugar transport system permease protein
MSERNPTPRAVSFALSGLVSALPVVVALLLTSGVIALAGQNPLEVFSLVWQGSVGSARTLGGVINFWMPLLLACLGLLVSFRAGLWNIGVEGQITLGTLGATAIALYPPELPAPLIVALAMLAAAGGGACWGLLIGLLKTRLGVHEIFGGTALNALANVATIYLISGPWLPAEGGSAQGTAPFADAARLPALSGDFAISSAMLALVGVAVISVIAALRFTRWGLMLKATGKNARSALLLGVPVEGALWSSLIVCGALAGLAGAFRVLFVYGNLRPLASGGIGFLALLVILLAGMRPLWTLVIAFAFAAILTGSTRLKITLQLDQSLAGVLQGLVVLVSLLFEGVRERWRERSERGLRAPDATISPQQPSPEA